VPKRYAQGVAPQLGARFGRVAAVRLLQTVPVIDRHASL
jgi:hypothetical protein